LSHAVKNVNEPYFYIQDLSHWQQLRVSRTHLSRASREKLAELFGVQSNHCLT